MVVASFGTMDDVTTPGQTMPSDDSTPSAAPPARRGMPGGIKSMLISTVVVVAACLVWWAFVPRVNRVSQPVEDVAGIAREIGLQQHWDPAVADGLPAGWQAVNVTLLDQSGQPATWQAGYDGPNNGYAAVLQTNDGGASWVNAQTGGGSTQGTVTIGGVAWTKVQRSDGDQRSLVRSSELSGLSTVVTGTGSWAQIEQFAAAVKPLSKSSLVTNSGLPPAN